jgi:hypothetical protein
MPDFDFNKMLNEAGQAAVWDAALPHWMLCRHGVAVPGGHSGDKIATVMLSGVVVNCALNQLCPPAVVALMVAKLCDPVAGADPQEQVRMKAHVLQEIRSVLDAIECGEI